MNEEKETAGINKNIIAQLSAPSFFKPIFFDKLYNAQATKKYTKDGISLSEIKLSPNKDVYKEINQDRKGGFE